jgi:hypothetical protein
MPSKTVWFVQEATSVSRALFVLFDTPLNDEHSSGLQAVRTSTGLSRTQRSPLDHADPFF